MTDAEHLARSELTYRQADSGKWIAFGSVHPEEIHPVDSVGIDIDHPGGEFLSRLRHSGVRSICRGRLTGKLAEMTDQLVLRDADHGSHPPHGDAVGHVFAQHRI